MPSDPPPTGAPVVDIYRQIDDPHSVVVLVDGVRVRFLTAVQMNLAVKDIDTVTLTFAANVRLFDGIPQEVPS